MRPLFKFSLLPFLVLLPLAGQTTFDFSAPVQLSTSEAAGKWYVDRFAPHGFVSPVFAPDGTGNALKESIAGSDLQPYPASAFYNTQGRKYDLATNTLSVTIQLYVPSAWATLNGRAAGFWGTAFESNGTTVGDYPIIEFQGPTTSDAHGPSYQPNGGVAGFYGWDNTTGTYKPIGLPSGFAYDSWVQLTITLVPGSKFTYTVATQAGSLSLDSPLSDNADAFIGNVILQGYNYGQDYDIFWGGGPLSSLPMSLDYSSWWFWYVSPMPIVAPTPVV